jgi:hypothetical protein
VSDCLCLSSGLRRLIVADSRVRTASLSGDSDERHHLLVCRCGQPSKWTFNTSRLLGDHGVHVARTLWSATDAEPAHERRDEGADGDQIVLGTPRARQADAKRAPKLGGLYGTISLGELLTSYSMIETLSGEPAAHGDVCPRSGAVGGEVGQWCVVWYRSCFKVRGCGKCATMWTVRMALRLAGLRRQAVFRNVGAMECRLL